MGVSSAAIFEVNKKIPFLFAGNIQGHSLVYS